MAPVTRGIVPKEYGAPVGAPVPGKSHVDRAFGSTSALTFSIGSVARVLKAAAHDIAELKSDDPGTWS